MLAVSLTQIIDYGPTWTLALAVSIAGIFAWGFAREAREEREERERA